MFLDDQLPDHPAQLNFLVYWDDFTPGDAVRPESNRQFAAFYFTATYFGRRQFVASIIRFFQSIVVALTVVPSS